MKNPNTYSTIGISENMGYLFTDKGVTKLSLEKNDLNGRNFVPYTFEHLNIALDIIKENLNFKYKIGKISLLEYSSEPRKFLNFLVEIYQPKNPISVIKEWENNFGNKLLLINESEDNLIVEQRINESWGSFIVILEQWYNRVGEFFSDTAKNVKDWTVDQGKQIKDKGFIQWGKEKAENVWNYVKDNIAAAWNCAKSGVECIMEGMRKLVFTAAGTALLTGVSTIPVVGQVTNGIIFGSLLIWDIYKGLSGKGWDIMNIVVDSIALILPVLGKVVKTAFLGIKTFSQIGAAAVTKGGIFAKVFNALKSGIGTLQSAVGKAATWLGEKLGLKSLQAWGGRVQQKLGGMVDEMVTGAGGKPVVGGAKSLSVKSLTPTQKTQYDKLLNAWRQQQKALGKKNLNPGQATREKLIKQAHKPKTFKQGVKDIWSKKTPQPIPSTGKVIKSAAGTFVITAALCSALGLDGFSCQEKIESGEVTPEQIKAAEAEIQKAIGSQIDDIEFEL